MPRTASTTKTDRISPRTSTKFREERVTDQVPVLFRLPQVDCLPVPTAAGEPLFAAAEDEPESFPPPRVAPPVPTQSAPTSQAAQPSQAVHPSDAAHPRQAAQSSQNAAGLSSSATTVQPVTAQPLAAPQPVTAAQPVAATSYAANNQAALSIETDSERSWWEHWSSGVVLILLIIALVTASIIAFKDAGSADPSLLAQLEDKPIETLDLTIPELTPPQVTTADPQPAPQDTNTLKTNNTQLATSGAAELGSTEQPTAAAEGLILGGLIPDDLEFETPGSGTAGAVAVDPSTAEAASDPNTTPPPVRPLASLVDGQKGTSAATSQPPAGAALLAPQTSTTATTIPLASARLSPPIGVELPPLFPEGELSLGESSVATQTTTSQTPTWQTASQQASAQPTPSAGSTSGSSASGSSVSGSSTSSNSSWGNSPAGNNTAAQSPGLTDGALTVPSGLLEQPLAPTLGTSPNSTQPGTNSLIDTELPSYQAMLVGSSASSSGQTGLIPNVEPANTTAVPPTTNAPAATGMPATETPDLSTDAIIRAWQMHKAVNQAQAAPSNRYANPNSTSTGGAMSYTLGEPTSTVNPTRPGNTTLPGTSSTGTNLPANSLLPR